MNVLSLFDGISACRLALQRAGYKVDNYYTSEVDTFVTTVSLTHFPDQVPLGDITNWESWQVDWSSIDLVTGGFPCQTWSLAGSQEGDKDPRGQLFWVMLDVMKKVMLSNPKAKFFIENVPMKKDFDKYITSHIKSTLGDCEKVNINSSRVSAQKRQRTYWTNIKGITQPKDKGIVIADILDEVLNTAMIHSAKAIAYMERGNDKWMQEGNRRADRYTQFSSGDKTYTLTANFHKGVPYNYLLDQRYDVLRKFSPVECERLQTFPPEWTASISDTQRYKALGNAWTVDVVAHCFSFISKE